jgi:FMN-dependent NADH-azoreductase
MLGLEGNGWIGSPPSLRKGTMKVLHIVATPRAASSNTLRLANAFMTALMDEAPDCSVDTLDLFADDLPKVAGGNIDAKYTLMTGAPIGVEHSESWAQIERLIERFLAADAYVISVPMWNLSIPYALKYFIDAVVQPGYLFRYNEMGVPEGMVLGRKMIVITSRGGDYSTNSPFHAYDFMEPYLRAIFGFVGVYDIEFVYAQPVDIQRFRDAAIKQGMTEAVNAARRLATGTPKLEQERLPDALIPQVVLESTAEPHSVMVAAGRVVFEEGADSDFIYMIDDGTVEVFRSTADGEEVLATLQRGQYFGELGVLLGAPRAAGIRTKTDATFTACGPEEFRRMILPR